jgi:hypothetical protein
MTTQKATRAWHAYREALDTITKRYEVRKRIRQVGRDRRIHRIGFSGAVFDWTTFGRRMKEEGAS